MIQHHQAMSAPRGIEVPLVAMFQGLISYPLAFRYSTEARLGTSVVLLWVLGDDGVLADHWIEMAQGFLSLLNGPTGRLDCGTLDRSIREVAEQNGLNL